MTKEVPKRRPRQLLDPDIEEVSLVDRPASGIDFCLIKRRRLDMSLVEIAQDATAMLERLAEEVQARLGDKAKHWEDILRSDEEKRAMAELVEAFEKVFGPYPYPLPFRKPRYPYPYPRADTYSKAYPYPRPKQFDFAVFSNWLRAALDLPQMPDDVKTKLLDFISWLDARAAGAEPAEKYVSRREFDEKLGEVLDTLKEVLLSVRS